MKLSHYIVGVSAALMVGALVGKWLFPKTAGESGGGGAAAGLPGAVPVTALPAGGVDGRTPEALLRTLEAGRRASNPARAEHELEAMVRAMSDAEVLAVARRIVAGDFALTRYELGFLNAIWRRYSKIDPIAAHRDALLLSTRAMRSSAVSIAAAAWATADPAGALAAFISAASEGGVIEASSLGSAFQVLVQNDPAEAIATLDDHREASWYSRARGSLFYHWSQVDAEAASEWLIGEMKDKPGAARGVLLDLATQEPGRAIEIACDMGPTAAMRDAVGEIIVGRWLWRDRDAALAAFRDLPAAWHSRYSAENFGRNAVTESSAGEIASLAAVFPEGEIRDEFWHGAIGRRASDARFEDAVGLLSHLAPGPRAESAANLAGQWAKANPNEASEWLASLDPGPVRDHAVGRFARTIAPIDPVAARRWAESIADEAERERAIEGLGS